MSDFKDLIADLHLEDVDEDKSESKSQFNMDGSDTQPKKEHKKHIGSDNRGKWQRTPEYREKKSLQMKELWQDSAFKEYMSERLKGVPHVFVNKREPVDGYIWSEEARRRYSEKVRDTIFINNGFVNKRLKRDQPIPKGWVRGRLNKENRKCQ